MKKENVIVVNGTVIAEQVIRQEWELVKEKLLKSMELSSYSEEQGQKAKHQALVYAKKNVIERTLLEGEALKRVEDIPFNEIKGHYEKLVNYFGGMEAFTKKFSTPPQTANNSNNNDNDIPPQENLKVNPFEIQANIEKSLKVDKLIEIWEQELPALEEADFKSFYQNNQKLYPAKDRVVVTLVEGIGQSDGSGIDWEMTEENLLALKHFYEEAQEKSPAPHKLIDSLVEQAQKLDGLLLRERVVFERGTLDQAVEDYVFDEMKEHTLSGLVRAKDNLHLFWKFEILDTGFWNFEHVYESVKKDARMAQRNELVRKKLVQLQTEAEIEDYFHH